MERKKLSNKKIAAFMMGALVLVLGVGALVFWFEYPRVEDFGTAGVFREETVQEKTRELIQLFSNQEYQEILDSYAGKALKKDADAEKLENAAILVSMEWGDFQKINSITLGEMKKAGKWYALAESEVAYENVTVTFTFSFDKDMRLAGVYMK